MRTAAGATRWACVLGAFVSAAACSRNDAARPAGTPVSAVREPDSKVRAGPDLTEAPVIGADAGLEATWVVAGADGATFAGAIAPYLDAPVPAHPSNIAMWEANGLRVVRIPLGEWPALSAALQVSGASQRQWLGASGAWTEIVRGPDQPRGQIIALDAERVELGPGRLRLLSRCWLSPVPPEGSGDGSSSRAEFTVEVVPQLLERRPGATTLTQAPRTQDPIDQGLVFSRMRMLFRTRDNAEDRYAYLIVSERPDVDWRDAIADRPESDNPPVVVEARPSPGVGEVVRNGSGNPGSQAVRASTESGPPSAGPAGAGPQAPLLPTLGEALFAAALPPLDPEATPVVRRNVRAMLVLIPRAPGEYRLIPPAPVSTAGRDGRGP